MDICPHVRELNISSMKKLFKEFLMAAQLFSFLIFEPLLLNCLLILNDLHYMILDPNYSKHKFIVNYLP